MAGQSPWVSWLLGTVGLDVAAAAALYLTVRREYLDRAAVEARAAAHLVLAIVGMQAAHFTEELATGFYTRFPELLGLAAWPRGLFVAFNLAWIAIWALSAFGLSARVRAALFPLWFLGIAGVANGVAHPLFSLVTGGYFPGLLTSPLVGVAGVVLLRRLARLTAGPPRSR